MFTKRLHLLRLKRPHPSGQASLQARDEGHHLEGENNCRAHQRQELDAEQESGPPNHVTVDTLPRGQFNQVGLPNLLAEAHACCEDADCEHCECIKALHDVIGVIIVWLLHPTLMPNPQAASSCDKHLSCAIVTQEGRNRIHTHVSAKQKERPMQTRTTEVFKQEFEPTALIQSRLCHLPLSRAPGICEHSTYKPCARQEIDHTRP
mmetsp:Transcript_26237/g.60566  ORF Transcript_26237/g.60566 Transcript_26237/m.60566 type:complete len:206 (-) Transcript_26237:412-1029(-)